MNPTRALSVCGSITENNCCSWILVTFVFHVSEHSTALQYWFLIIHESRPCNCHVGAIAGAALVSVKQQYRYHLALQHLTLIELLQINNSQWPWASTNVVIMALQFSVLSDATVTWLLQDSLTARHRVYISGMAKSDPRRARPSRCHQNVTQGPQSCHCNGRKL